MTRPTGEEPVARPRPRPRPRVAGRRVRVVTDSSAYLSPDLLRRLDIEVVPLTYTFEDGEPQRETPGEDFTPFFARLESEPNPSRTAPPAREDFVRTYEALANAGDDIVSVHISSGISDTCAIAREAAADLGTRSGIEVIDSATTAGALGLIVLAAARAAQAGVDFDEVIRVTTEARAEARMRFLVDTLTYLRRGGRIGTAAAWIGSALSVKPILTIEAEIRAVERVRTRERAIDALVEFGRKQLAAGSDAWCVQHTACEDDARALATRLQERSWRPPEFLTELGPTIGSHTGPGTLVLATIPARLLGRA